MGILDDILAQKRVEIEALKDGGIPPSAVSHDLGRRPLDVASILGRPIGAPLRLISEIKRKSPSAGPLSKKMSVADRAVAYANAGATMVSVLCDETFFDGSFDHLGEARAALDAHGHRGVPLLCKEFVLDPIQMDIARARGADAILIIARAVSAAALPELVEAARSRGLEPIVEAVNAEECARVFATSTRIVGINARDLDTLKMDSSRATDLVAAVPPNLVALHFSGVKSTKDVSQIARGRADGALIGEALMREDDPSHLLESLVDAANG